MSPNASLSEKNIRMMIRMKKLPVRPTLDWFRENLDRIVQRLAEETTARVALLSPPVLGEELGSDPVRRSTQYSDVVKEIAQARDVAYLDLNERQISHLRAGGHHPGIPFTDGRALSSRAAMQHFMLRRSFDDISRRRGLSLTTDMIHQNTRGAAIIADVIEEFLNAPVPRPTTARASTPAN
jgi:lysophospholipase L1-like esterase